MSRLNSAGSGRSRWARSHSSAAFRWRHQCAVPWGRPRAQPEVNVRGLARVIGWRAITRSWRSTGARVRGRLRFGLTLRA